METSASRSTPQTIAPYRLLTDEARNLPGTGLAASAFNVARGIKTILEMIEEFSDAFADDDAPLLNNSGEMGEVA